MTGILLGIGYYSTSKVSGGRKDLAVIIVSIIGITIGALLIITGILTTGYNLSAIIPWFSNGEPGGGWYIGIPTPNFLFILIGLMVIGLTLILLLGSARVSVRVMTERATTCNAAIILSTIGVLVFIISSLIGIIGIIANNIPIVTHTATIAAVIGLGLMLVAFILWAAVFYSLRNI